MVADRVDSPDARFRRFGFEPDDTGLPESAAWPVLFYDALEEDRARRSKCKEVMAGSSMLLWSENPVDVHAPGGKQTTLKPNGGRVLLNGLDSAGAYRLSSADGEAMVVVRRDVMRADTEKAWVAPPTLNPPVDRESLWWACLVGFMCLLALSYRRPWCALISMLILFIGFWEPNWWGEKGTLSLLSMSQVCP